jgi:peptidoglycan/xylan/chitin deacetylase (PgdA/CDA1 family)
MFIDLAARALAPNVLVLCYHAVSPRWAADLSVTPARLTRQLELLVRGGYRGATFTEAVSRESLSSPVVAVTFDDAYRSVLELAFPILSRLNLPATVFVPTGQVARGGAMAWDGIEHWHGSAHERELVPLTWDEMRYLASAGWEIGSHTVAHPRLTTLSDTELARELHESRAVCEAEIGEPCRSIAYPYGDVDRRVADAALVAGYAAGAGLPQSLRPWHQLAWPRVGVYHRDDERRFALKVSETGRRLRSSRAYHAIAVRPRPWARPAAG